MTDDGVRTVFTVKRNDLCFMATVINDRSGVGGDGLAIMQMLRLLVEVIEETITLEKIKEHFYSVACLLDTFIDYGMPLLTEKPLLVAMMQKPSQASALLNTLTMVSGSSLEK